MFYLLLIHAVFATVFTLSKAGLQYIQPIFFVSLRSIGSGVILLTYYFFTAKKVEIIKNHYWLLAKLAFFQVYCAFVFEFPFLNQIHSTYWSLFYALAPLITAFFSYRHFNEQFNFKKVVGFLIACIGLISTIFANNLQKTSGLWSISLPELALLLSVTSYAYSCIIAQKLIQELRYPIFLVSGMSMLWGGIPLLCTSPFIDNWSEPLITTYELHISLILIGIIFGTAFVISVNNSLLRFYSATFLIFLSFIDPCYVALYGRLFLNETISYSFFISFFVISLGLYIFYQEDLHLAKIKKY